MDNVLWDEDDLVVDRRQSSSSSLSDEEAQVDEHHEDSFSSTSSSLETCTSPERDICWLNVLRCASAFRRRLAGSAGVLQLRCEHLLEARDPKHRYGANLRLYYNVWWEREAVHDGCSQQSSGWEETFFHWLDRGSGKNLDLADLGVSRAKLDSQIVQYLTPEEAAELEVVIDPKDGLLKYNLTGIPVHTHTMPASHLQSLEQELLGSSSHNFASSDASYNHSFECEIDQPRQTTVHKPQQSCDRRSCPCKSSWTHASRDQSPIKRMNSFAKRQHAQQHPLPPAGWKYSKCGRLKPIKPIFNDKWIYVFDTNRTMFVHRKQRGAFHHSSFVRGGAVFAAGGLAVDNGRIWFLTAHSGHYHPSDLNFLAFTACLQELGADLRYMVKDITLLEY